MAEWEVQERAVNKTGEVNTLLIITNKQTNIRMRLELARRTRPFSLSSNGITVCAYLNV